MGRQAEGFVGQKSSRADLGMDVTAFRIGWVTPVNVLASEFWAIPQPPANCERIVSTDLQSLHTPNVGKHEALNPAIVLPASGPEVMRSQVAVRGTRQHQRVGRLKVSNHRRR